jgi:arabinan endo-1,5-alpha-L-arabinosidase
MSAAGRGTQPQTRPIVDAPAVSLLDPRSAAGAVPRRDLAGAIVGVTDPSIIKEGDTYYLFSSGSGIPIRASNDLVHWRAIGQVFGAIPSWARSLVPGATEFWAPDVSFFDGEYHLYYAVSTFGSDRSVIGLATNPTLDPTASDYDWADRGEVIASVPGRTDWNAIDPNLVVADDSAVWLAFGSQWSGIKLIRIDPRTGKPADRASGSGRSRSPRWFSIASRPASGSIEAAFLFPTDGYYYLFASVGDCCMGAASTYRIVVGRSRSIIGPYRARDGVAMTRGGGTRVLGSMGPYRGPGSNAVLSDGGRDWIVYQVYDAGNGGSPELAIRSLDWTRSGWPVVGAPPAGAS